MSISVGVVILAAGKGKRMCSRQPKVLHLLGGRPLVQHLIDTVRQLAVCQCYLVYGHEGEQLQARLGQQPLQWIHQAEQQGTGHAVQQLLPHVSPELSEQGVLLVLYGDVPLITCDTLRRLLAAKPVGGISLLTAELAEPDGYGRVLREQRGSDTPGEGKWGARDARGAVVGIIEHRDADEQQRQIREVNSGILVAGIADLQRWLSQLSNHNSAKEYYLTDIIALARAEGGRIETCHPEDSHEIMGINDRWQLAQLERYYQAAQAKRLCHAGVTLSDPTRFDLRGELVHGTDVIIESNVLLQDRVVLGDRVTIGMGCLLSDCTIGDDCQIKPYTVIEGSTIAAGCIVGPFARLRPGSALQEAARVGNFVEMKQARLGKGSKANHLSYLGDAELGDNVNIGAGTITCNYNGAEKLRTVIGNDVFVGAGSQLVAPITIDSGATIGAGTTLTQSVAKDELVVGRAPQRHIKNWQRPGERIKKTPTTE